MAGGQAGTDADAGLLCRALEAAGELVRSIGAEQVAGMSIKAFDGRVAVHLVRPGDAAEVAARLGLGSTVDYESPSGDFRVWEGVRNGWPVLLFGARGEPSTAAREE